ncbi:hypothetical protein BDP27DRAFT_1445718 [Rhodocollybia butyracea]|uniref:F-box domain-containing protein n=1 Tax=Rhodocollybia butyracea TaxID=206335 RepID=A0A9P5Q0M1_9AGAR|nr:hypothetical protein BDP27DRAFT_1445718 [Rhodocollybia butyracea]
MNHSTTSIVAAIDTPFRSPNDFLSSCGQNIPYDILRTIFEILCQTSSPGPSSSLIVSHVCSSWRYVAIHSPTIWTSIRINLNRPYQEQHHQLLEKLVERSCPLKISFEISARRMMSDSEVGLVEKYASQMKTFTISTPGARLMYWFIQSLTCQFPVLEEFSFIADGLRYFSVSRSCIPGTSFHLPPVSKNFVPDWQSTQWPVTNITKLELVHLERIPTWAQLSSILKACGSTLLELKFHGNSPFLAFDDMEHDGVELRHLQSFSLGYFDMNIPLTMMVRMPSLRKLHLRDLTRCTESPTAPRGKKDPMWDRLSYPTVIFQSMLTLNPLPQLEELGLWGIYGGTSINGALAFKNFITLTPKLRKLYAYAISPIYFDVLYDTSGGLLFPALSELTVTESGSQPDKIVSYMSSRVELSSPRLDKLSVAAGCLHGDLKTIVGITKEGARKVAVFPSPIEGGYSRVDEEDDLSLDLSCKWL